MASTKRLRSLIKSSSSGERKAGHRSSTRRPGQITSMPIRNHQRTGEGRPPTKPIIVTFPDTTYGGRCTRQDSSSEVQTSTFMKVSNSRAKLISCSNLGNTRRSENMDLRRQIIRLDERQQKGKNHKGS